MSICIISSNQLIESVAQALNSLFAAQVKQNRPFLFLASGGSAVALLDHIDPQNFGQLSTVGVLDERFSEDPDINNFAQLQKTAFYERVCSKGTHIIDTKIQPNESQENAAARFELSLRNWQTQTNGTVIATVGIGNDAHTSGIMPYPENPDLFRQKFDDPSVWVKAYDAENKNPHRLRITTTIPFLRKIDFAIIFVSGQAKKPALQKLLSETGTLNESPCRIWREIPGAVVYTDITL